MIELRGLGKNFDGTGWVFRDVSLSVGRGRSAAVVGPSGSGKSVLLKIIAGLLPASEGDISLASPNLGMLFQKNALFNSLSVEENLTFPLQERKGVGGRKARERASALLKEVGLAGTERLFPDELSGGMQKRLGIARALIVEPEIILYDEPTAGLDPVTSRMIAELIRGLQAESGGTLLTVTNDMNRAYQLGDAIYLLARGALSPGGTPEDSQIARSPDPAIHLRAQVRAAHHRGAVMSIRFEGVSKAFGRKIVLKELSFVVNRGEILFVLGKSEMGGSRWSSSIWWGCCGPSRGTSTSTPRTSPCWMRLG